MNEKSPLTTDLAAVLFDLAIHRHAGTPANRPTWPKIVPRRPSLPMADLSPDPARAPAIVPPVATAGDDAVACVRLLKAGLVDEARASAGVLALSEISALTATADLPQQHLDDVKQCLTLLKAGLDDEAIAMAKWTGSDGQSAIGAAVEDEVVSSPGPG